MTQGVDEPDARGRVDLHLTGLDLDGNPDVVIREVRLLASNWHILRTTRFDERQADGSWLTKQSETYDRGNGATILLYDVVGRTVLLTRQFRFPAYVNGHPDGMLLETAAGLLDADDPETAIRRETIEETGHELGAIQHVFDAYMSPGSVTERVHFFAAAYDAGTRRSAGGGLAEEGERIELVELDIDEAVAGIGSRIIDGKTIMLLQWAVLNGPFAR
jgi:nudix-type nucleoside diphosphatase (YffH/AdpP family)